MLAVVYKHCAQEATAWAFLVLSGAETFNPQRVVRVLRVWYMGILLPWLWQSMARAMRWLRVVRALCRLRGMDVDVRVAGHVVL